MGEARKDDKGHDRHRQDGHRRPCQRDIGCEQNDDRAHQQDHRADQLQESLPDEQADLLHVIGGADHQLPGLVLIVIGERQILDLGVQIVAQVIRHRLRIFLRPVGLQEGEETAQDGEEHDRDQCGQQRLGRVRHICLQLHSQLVQREGRGSACHFENPRERRADEVRRDLVDAFQDLIGNVAARHRVDDVAYHARHSQLRKRGNDEKDIWQGSLAFIVRQIFDGASNALKR